MKSARLLKLSEMNKREKMVAGFFFIYNTLSLAINKK